MILTELPVFVKVTVYRAIRTITGPVGCTEACLSWTCPGQCNWIQPHIDICKKIVNIKTFCKKIYEEKRETRRRGGREYRWWINNISKRKKKICKSFGGNKIYHCIGKGQYDFQISFFTTFYMLNILKMILILIMIF